MGQSRWTIYCHIHVASGRRYVGLTKKTWKQRWNQHVYTATKLAEKGWSHFANALRRYGKDAFSHEVLEVCGSLEEANAAEVRWIEHFDSTNPERGFNLEKGGSHTPHPVNGDYRDAPDFREKASARSRKIWEDPAKRLRISSAVSKAVRTPEVRERISAGMRSLWEDPDYRESAVAAAEKRYSDPAVREKLRRNWDDPDFRERCSAGPRAHAVASLAKTHCVNGHERTSGNLNKSRECKTCISESRKARKTHCPKGHEYSDENVRLSSSGRRMCVVCLEASKDPRPCAKCGRPKDMKVGDRIRCRPCTNARISAWHKARRASSVSS